MPTVVGVILRNTAKPELFDASGLELAADDVVVVTTERGQELGRVHDAARERAARESLDDVNRVERAATDDDLAKAEDLRRKEREAIPVYRRLVEKHKLDMKPTDVEFLFDESRAVFYFVAEERVDFRELVRDLAAEFHMRVDMRQIGVRDEARMIGGLGHCGEQLCCDRFGGEFQPVSIRMAKEQDLPLNPLKISGLCGRLMCCLRYENDAYKDFKTRAPKKGAIIDIGGSLAKVVEMNTPREMITMRKEDGSRVTFPLADMECCSGQGCPCSVKAEAIERSMASMGLNIAGAVGSSMRERKLTESTMPRDAAPAAPSSTPAKAQPKAAGRAPATGPVPAANEPSKRRRRRRGGGGGGGGAEGGQPAADASAKPARAPRQAASKQAAQPSPTQAPAGETGATAGHKRRRRRRGGASGGAGEAPAS